MNNINNLDGKDAILSEADDNYDSDPGYLTDSSSQPNSKNTSLRSLTKRTLTEEETEIKRVTANSQERCRMQRLNYALDSLRRCLPPQLQVCHRRLSKIRTLKLAADYISTLAEILNEHCASKYSLAQRRTLGMDPRFVNTIDIDRKDVDVFKQGKRKDVSKSLDPQCRAPVACLYDYNDGVSGIPQIADVNSGLSMMAHHPISVYQEIRNERQNIPYYSISKDEFGQEFGHPAFPWYNKSVFVGSNSSDVIHQL